MSGRILHKLVQLCLEMIDYGAVFGLRTEQDDLRVTSDSHGVPRWPVEEIASGYALLRPIQIRHRDLAFNHVSPMRGLAAIGLEALEERGDICACFQGKVFASDGAITGRIAEVEYLTGDCAGNVETRLDILFCDSHVFLG